MGTKWGKNRKTGSEVTNCLPPQILNISGLSKSQQKMTTSPSFTVSIPKGPGWGGIGGGRRYVPPGPSTALRASFLPPEGVQPQTLVVSMWAMTMCFFRKTDTLVKYEEKVMGNICQPFFFN